MRSSVTVEQAIQWTQDVLGSLRDSMFRHRDKVGHDRLGCIYTGDQLTIIDVDTHEPIEGCNTVSMHDLTQVLALWLNMTDYLANKK